MAGARTVIDMYLAGLPYSHLTLMEMIMDNNLRDVAFHVLSGQLILTVGKVVDNFGFLRVDHSSYHFL